jgi:tetratricopeptide (TPR) repeat protein
MMLLHSLALFLALWLVAAPASAESDNPETFRALYAELMLDPTNVDKTLEYAALAVEMKDYEAAIPPLERLLLSYPNASKIQLELGELYTLLGSDAAAKSYFEDVLQNAQAEADHVSQAKAHLAKEEGE